MKNTSLVKPNYSNWVSKKLIYIPGLVCLLCLALSFAFPLLTIFTVLFFLIFVYFAYAWYRFSPAGGDVQDQIQQLIFAHLDWDGKGNALDIGCGNGPLAIKLAKKYPGARVAGIDYWGMNWDYSKTVCEKNAEIEGVKDRTVFQKASASALPFEDETYDLAVSNLVFHEVSQVKDKRELIKEGLRVVKKGGKFAFQDLFLEKQLYGDTKELVDAVKSWGIKKVEFIVTCDEPFIPRLLKLPFMVGKIGILYGEK